METGYVQVFVTSAREAIPLAAAKVELSQQGAVLATLATDASGKTELSPILAPDAAYSLDSEYTGEVYSICDVSVSAAGYKRMTISSVQVFAGEIALVPVFMEPAILENGFETPVFNLPSEREVGDHGLENPNGSLAPDVPPRILDRVIIPEYITVHLGTPDSSAQNVTVSFPYYIKNVCSSEIYPTWPTNSIIANIHCQVSLALNRIFTEWYRSRGYPFDITNSTQYDQYFVNGRNIYANISDLVDSYFDIYIQKSNFVEPYYAEYCNGTTANCPGLKQWGTVTLAQDGYTPIQILRYYYGSDINLREVDEIGGTSVSYAGTALRVGSAGAAVSTIQSQLSRIRQNYPLIPDIGTIDGRFGARTRAAVVAFQQIFDLTADGVVGRATWYRISFIYAAVLRLAELTSEGIQGVPIPASPPSNVIRLGSTGEFVSLAQYMLTISATFYDAIPPLRVDGIFGTATRDAVYAFQRLTGLVQDGIIGQNTWRALYEVFYGAFDSITPANLPYPGTALRIGSSGNNVSIMQRKLNVISQFFPSVPAIAVDGSFGNATRAAVVAFQRLFGLTADGIIGPRTWNQIILVYDTLVG